MTSCALDMVTQRDPLFVQDPVGSLSCKEWDVSGSRICVVSRARSRSWLHICVRSRASGQNSSYRSVRSNWLMNSTSFVDVSDETVTAFRQGCTAAFLVKTLPVNGQVAAQQGALVCGA